VQPVAQVEVVLVQIEGGRHADEATDGSEHVLL
jgi:hypothetical protein